MDERKLEIIVHMTDENLFARLTASLEKVNVPKNFAVEVQAVTGDKKFFAYETVRQASDAKFKIYIDERATVTNENFLRELLKIFSDGRIGLVGTSGAIELSTHGISLNSFKRTDKNFSGEVDVVDGFFIATQHDLPWRTDFADNFFGAQAHCVEFKRAGYKVFVPRQNRPWISVDGDISIDESARQKFLDEYSADLFPLVSVIIPTFNRPKYFREALDSALNQTYRNIEVFVSDNSTDDATENLIRTYADARIKYVRHRDFNASDNWNFARSYDNPKAEFVNWLMDDDKFYPTKLEKMVEIMRRRPDVSLVTSVRHVIDADGNVTDTMPGTLDRNIFQPGEIAGRNLLLTCQNDIGEPTTPLIRKNCLRDGDLCRTADERGFYPLIDVSTWLQVLSRGNLIWLAEPLSAFRFHEQQASNWERVGSVFSICWAHFLEIEWRNKFFLRTESDFRAALLKSIAGTTVRLLKAQELNYRDENIIELENVLSALAAALTNGYKLKLPPAKFFTSDKNNVFG
ncbi:MAG: glycosyltransferase [Selenomonadaceae bacterium]|nr:glycosyltransferase [Selenomonadaceae bacterium]